MQFKVPQFIDIEDKVVGNLSFKQFAYLAGGAGLCYISIRLLPSFVSLFLVPALAGLALALAFIKINEKPFAHILEAFVRYYLKSRLYLWKKQKSKPQNISNTKESSPLRATLSESKLKTLSWSLDVIDPKK
ncbi:MAG TPA: PrgI family protein [Candidatus Paceibacterota bacterium]|jgi:hypothetical protein|nr:PrgI family protein [Candidatus Paceibacterota bacterium]